METKDKSALMGKIASGLIVALIVAGSFFLPAVADLDEGGGMLAILFLGFFGAIIAIQVVPGLMLFGMMIKGLCSLVRREPAAESKKAK